MNWKTFTVLLLVAVALPATAGPLERKLADGKKQEVRHSMIGPRDTLLFYTFADLKAVLCLQIAKKEDLFPVSGTVYLFAPKTTGEQLEKWINNQHSDGLFPDVPPPSLVFNLPASVCTATLVRPLGESKEGLGGELYRDYKVKVSVKAHREAGKFELAPFTDSAGVFEKVTKK